ncbi:hypothetical protein DMN77_00800 [Paenibacillus sp. 79R4]|uniref:hypothetical protein n=1 Tax=Paenibacillus sp. 79R4 TaxID=2212847 RepID=UPI0015C11C1B|nr:hypothetical protein [Paenibacillus sp. 79R4]NWL86132.1 hypothetical protein [Paenibacillus sp. 79R4]
MKNNKKFLIIGILIMVVGIIFISKFSLRQEYKEVSEEQISEIVEKEKITLLNKEIIVSKDIPVTVISYRRDNEIGSIEATNHNGKLDFKKALTTAVYTEKKVEILGVNNGLCYIILTFYNEDLLLKSKKISIFYNNIQKDIDRKNENEVSLIIPLADASNEKSGINLTSIEFFDADNNIIFNYPSDLKSNDYYDYLYSAKTINLLEKETNFSKLKTNSNLPQLTSIFDTWLYVMSVQVNENEKNKIVDFIKGLESDKGHYYASYKEKNQNGSLKPYLYLLDTKMAMEIFRELQMDIPNKENVYKYLQQTDFEISKSELDFVSEGGFIVLINEIIDIINSEDTNRIDTIHTNLDDLVDLFKKAPSSIDKYSTALDLMEFYPNIDLKLDNKEISSYMNKIQQSNGLFNMEGYTDGYNALSTYLAVDILTKLNITIPKKDQLLESIKAINVSSLTE